MQAYYFEPGMCFAGEWMMVRILTMRMMCSFSDMILSCSMWSSMKMMVALYLISL